MIWAPERSLLDSANVWRHMSISYTDEHTDDGSLQGFLELRRQTGADSRASCFCHRVCFCCVPRFARLFIACCVPNTD
jgi:hypothetical protein